MRVRVLPEDWTVFDPRPYPHDDNMRTHDLSDADMAAWTEVRDKFDEWQERFSRMYEASS